MKTKKKDDRVPMENKTEEVKQVLDAFTQKFFGRSIRDHTHCVTCGSDKVKFTDFRDDLSRKEFMISLMCQSCQDTFTLLCNEPEGSA